MWKFGELHHEQGHNMAGVARENQNMMEHCMKQMEKKLPSLSDVFTGVKVVMGVC